MFHLICIVHDTDVDLSHYAQRLGFTFRIKPSFCFQFALNCYPGVKCCQYTSPFLSASPPVPAGPVATPPTPLSLSCRDEVCPVASGRHFPAGRLLPPRSSLQSRRYLYSTHTLCSTADSNTVSLYHCTVLQLYCIELCCSLPLQTPSLVWSRVATQWEKMTVFCRYVCMELSVKELQSLI